MTKFLANIQKKSFASKETKDFSWLICFRAYLWSVNSSAGLPQQRLSRR